jgi:hypothetical protein
MSTDEKEDFDFDADELSESIKKLREQQFYGVVKLVSGELLIAELTVVPVAAEVIVKVVNPLKLYEIPIFMENGEMYEKTVMQDFLPYSNSKTIMVNMSHIAFLSSISSLYTKKYMEYVDVMQGNSFKEFSSYISDVEEENVNNNSGSEEYDETQDQESEEMPDFGESDDSQQEPETNKKKWLH